MEQGGEGARRRRSKEVAERRSGKEEEEKYFQLASSELNEEVTFFIAQKRFDLKAAGVRMGGREEQKVQRSAAGPSSAHSAPERAAARSADPQAARHAGRRTEEAE